MMKIDKLTFHRRWAELLAGLSSEERLEVYDAIVKYGLDDEETSISSPTAKMAYRVICSDIDEERRHKHSVSKARSKAGRMGGKLGGRGRTKQPPAKLPENASPESPPPFEIIEDVEILEEMPEKPSTGVSSSTNLFGEDLPNSAGTRPQKQKKPPKKHYAPEVLMTEVEYWSLVEKYGQHAADWCITKLDDYKAARGMTYKSDYRAILNWVIKEYFKENGRNSTNWQPDMPTAKNQRDAEFANYIAGKLGSAGAP